MAQVQQAEGLMDLGGLAVLVGVAFALASYWVLHGITMRPASAPEGAQQIGQMATATI
jgi:hypothetical protein